LVELVLASLLLTPVFVLAYEGMRLIYARLELIRLTREAALYMIHESQTSLSKDILSDMAKRSSLDPDNLSSSLSSSAFDLDSSSSSSSGTMATLATQFALGSKLTLHYKVQFSGALRRLAPEGLDLNESVSLQTGYWKNLGMKELFSMIHSWFSS
jgi:hypothetical protein